MRERGNKGREGMRRRKRKGKKGGLGKSNKGREKDNSGLQRKGKMRTRKRRGKRGGLGKRNPGEEGNTDEGGKENTTVWAKAHHPSPHKNRSHAS